MTSFGEHKIILKATAYMIRCTEFENLIRKISAGILKEVSISCNIDLKLCSICNQTFKDGCNHIPGNFYDEKQCFLKLYNPVDAYEWSFVPIPAQLGAHTLKHFHMSQTNPQTSNTSEFENQQKLKLKKQILKLGFLCGFDQDNSKDPILNSIIKKMNFNELEKLKKEFESILSEKNFQNNLFSENQKISKLPKKETYNPYLI